MLLSEIEEGERSRNGDKSETRSEIQNITFSNDLDDLWDGCIQNDGLHLNSIAGRRSVREQVRDLDKTTKGTKRKSLKGRQNGLCPKRGNRSSICRLSCVAIKEEKSVACLRLLDRSVCFRSLVKTESVWNGKGRTIDESKVSDQRASQ